MKLVINSVFADSLKTLGVLTPTIVKLSLLSLVINLAHAEINKPLDGIIAVVNDGIILRSELVEEKQRIQANARAGRQFPAEDIFNRQILEHLIITELQLQEARKRGITIDDTTLNQALRRISASKNLSLEQYRQKVINDGIDYVALREELRKELVIKRITQGLVYRGITVSDQELRDYIANQQSQKPDVEYLLSLIQVSIPEESDEETKLAAEQKAEKIYQDLLAGKDFADLAKAESDGRNAANGGDLGWTSLNALPAIFTKDIANLNIKEFSKPIYSSRAIHILYLRDTKGIERTVVKQYRARHILIEQNAILDDAGAHKKITQIRQDILDGTPFTKLANEHSTDSGTASKGGDLGWSEPGTFVKEFTDVLLSLPKNKVSEPFKTQFGWHIMELIGTRDFDKTMELELDQAYGKIFMRKAQVEEDLWIKRIRDEAYIDIRI